MFDPRLEHLHGHVVSQGRPSELLVTWLRGVWRLDRARSRLVFAS
jgi:hypothetical protein